MEMFNNERRHIASLDGLRGVAVLLVLGCHHLILNGGYMGVDLFFVLSGYLITTILRSSRHDAVYWKPFWIKRATRILPPFLLLLLLTSLLGFSSTIWQFVAYVFSFGDVMAYLRSHFEPLQPLWSLAVEEHFYLVWPFAVRSLQRRTLVLVLTILLVVEPLLRAIVSLYTPNWQVVYFLTPFRIDGLCWGALLALTMERVEDTERIRVWALPTLVASSAAWLLLRVVLGVRFTRDHPGWEYSSANYSLLALFSVSLITFLLNYPRSFVSRLFSWRVLTWIGKISYGMYLYQVLIRCVAGRYLGWGDRKLILIDLPVTILVSWISFRFFEQPIIQWGRNFARSFRPTRSESSSCIDVMVGNRTL
jgi:peptidoglycan/LPS O-acetylase OafA/YrhL